MAAFAAQPLIVESFSGEVLGASTSIYEGDAKAHELKKEISFPKVTFSPQIITTTAFDQKDIQEFEPIAYEIKYVDNDELEYGLEEITTPGVEGVTTLNYLVTYWVDEEIDRLLTSTEIQEPVTEIVSRGTKIIWREHETPDGTIKYWRKMRVWATKYDHTCLGCSHTTAVGAYLQKGVCAVDPTVIELWTSFYVDRYGPCTALDVGGAIKGNKIDLAFEDASKAAWGAEYTDIYLTNNAPE